jgi:hypothetical protein
MLTPIREAIVLPAVFLTVALLGGLRMADGVRLLPPSLTSIVLAFLLLGVLVRSGAIGLTVLMNGGRTSIENVSGAIVLATLFAASSQAINLLLPERGLLHATFAIFFFCQVMSMSASGARRTGLLRSLVVLFGSMFVLRFIVVEALYARDGGMLQRVLTTLMSGATLGSIAYDPNAPIVGYVACGALALYVTGLVLLPPTSTGAAIVRVERTSTLPTTLALATLLVTSSAGCGAIGDRAGDTKAAGPAADARDALVPARVRAESLARAQVWTLPSVPIAQADLGSNPANADGFTESTTIDCRIVVKPMSGSTPKFDCARGSGDVVRVKYGRRNPEIYSEVITTRLLSALGFGADRVFVIDRVRCAGCGLFPFQSLRCANALGTERPCFPHGADSASVTSFDDVVVERRMPGRRIEAEEDQGWKWSELHHVDAGRGGAPSAHVDALRLLASVIAHWDNKAENQRLVCPPGHDLPDGGCSRPIALLQDVGASFGPTSLNLRNWSALRVWADPRSCLVSMKHLPWDGATFPDHHISEDGRRFLLGLLEQLSSAQLEALFRGARLEWWSGGIGPGARQPSAWAAAFLDKVGQIASAGPCPAKPTGTITSRDER